MSVVNQVLNELEQRGAHDVSEPGTFVVVPPARGNYVVHLLAIALGVSIVLVAWIWISLKQLDVIPATLPGMEGKIIYKMPLPDLAAASSVEATVPVAQAARMEASRERFKPASRLSMALSSGQVPATSTANAVQASTPAAGIVATKPEAAARTQAEPVVVAPRSIAPAPDATPMKHVSAGQRADAEFRRAAKLMQLGRIDDAIAGYESALSLDASHDAARQALVALLLDAKRIDDAARVVMGGLNLAPENTRLTMLLARIQLDRGELDTAVTTLEKSLQYADGQPEYHAFFAALLQRQQRHEEALQQYRIVLQQAPDNGLWLMGYGLSLQATKHNPEARAAFQQALDSNSLTPELQMFVKQKLKEL
jgi:MSHA biogenesis protein MshN